ncbi:MAG: hypothetical protein FJ125_12550 [Deltaproteobacteria bacterium]|nr:hypothetical protein [Deltaproteobacteria bacterium]
MRPGQPELRPAAGEPRPGGSRSAAARRSAQGASLPPFSPLVSAVLLLPVRSREERVRRPTPTLLRGAEPRGSSASRFQP